MSQVAPKRAATLHKEPFNPKPGFTRRSDGGAHPVLARLPDVSGQPVAKPREARAAAAGFVDYRFDLPAGVEAGVDHGRAEVLRQATQPHMFHRSPRGDYRPRSFGNRSRVLPDSNPFSIPATSLLDRLAPLGRFLALFVLFTTVGTFLMSGRRVPAPSEPVRPQAPSASALPEVNQTLEPAPPITDHPTMATPSALGPLGTNSKSAINISKIEIGTASELADVDRESEVEPTKSIEEPQTTALLLARANGEPLPQVQTTEPSAPVNGVEDDPARSIEPARLSNEIRPMNSSRRPAVARLPDIFEAPRNAYHDNHQQSLY